MKKSIYEAKTYEEAKEIALKDLGILEENALIKVLEEKQGLIKKNVKIEVITTRDVVEELKNAVNTITKLMNISVNLEVRIRNKNIEMKIFSDNNAILIGKDGKVLESLQNVLRQIIAKDVGNEYKFTLDVEKYKERKMDNIEKTARRVAREVARTKVEAKLDTMNSYERRLVHNALANNKYVYTESIGEEPNRCVVIKLKNEN